MKLMGRVMLAGAGISLTAALLILPAPGQTAPEVSSEYSGQYTCAQGLTALTLLVQTGTDGSSQDVVMQFGPLPENPTIPSGSYLLHGVVDSTQGVLDLKPVSWIAQPHGYAMVGLSGHSQDGGQSFVGKIVYSQPLCAEFSVRRRY